MDRDSDKAVGSPTDLRSVPAWPRSP